MRRFAVVLSVWAMSVGPWAAAQEAPAPEAVLAEAEAALADMRDREAMRLYDLAVQAARAVLEKDAAADPRPLISALFGRGEAHAQFGRAAQALEDFDAALGIDEDPTSRAMTHYARAEVYAFTRRNPEAIAEYTAALELNPELIGGYYARGQLWRRSGDLRKALEDYDRELARNPGFKRAEITRADLLRTNPELQAP